MVGHSVGCGAVPFELLTERLGGQGAGHDALIQRRQDALHLLAGLASVYDDGLHLLGERHGRGGVPRQAVGKDIQKSVEPCQSAMQFLKALQLSLRRV